MPPPAWPPRSRRAAAPLFRPLAPDTPAPRYRAIKRALLAAIDDGHLPPGAQLPSEADLAQRFGVAVGTLRQALAELATEQVLQRRQGQGTFVATHNAERFLFQFFRLERVDGLREAPQVELVAFDRGRLEDDAAEALGRRVGDAAWVIENRLRLQGRPVAHDRLWLPQALFKGLTEKRLLERPSTLYRLYQDDFGLTVLRTHERAQAVAADRASARVLGVAPGTPLLQLRRTALGIHERPIEYRISSLHTGQHELVHTLRPD